MREARTAAAFAICTLLVIGIYWPGLHGGFLLDDSQNFATLDRYLAGEIEWWGVLFGTRSGPLARPVSFATFLANALISGKSAFAMKLTNVAIHGAVAWLAFVFLRRLLAHAWEDRVARHWALGIAIAWMLHPIHASTVLYAVQRMTQLSALFTLAALGLYLHARMRLVAGERATASLWLGVPALIVLATLSKETGILAPALVLWVEAYCRRWSVAAVSSPAQLNRFVVALCVAPIVSGLVVFAWRPDLLLSGYETRAFTLMQRTLTETRVLWDYVALLLLPDVERMTLFRDGYTISSGVTRPVATLFALAAWTAVIATGIALRRNLPLLLLGIGIFLVGHALESTIVPLEIYFEHRNYLPSLGVLLALSAALQPLLRRARPAPGLLRGAGIATCLVLAFATHARARTWGDVDALLAHAALQGGGSSRVHSLLAARAMERGDLDAALANIAAAHAHGANATAVALWRVLAHCIARHEVPEPVVAAVAVAQGGTATSATLLAVELVTDRTVGGRCSGVDPARLAQVIESALLHDAGAGHSGVEWRIHYNLARLHGSAGDRDSALAAAERAWTLGKDPVAAVHFARLAAGAGQLDEAERALVAAGGRAPLWDRRLREAIDDLVSQVRAAQRDSFNGSAPEGSGD